MGKRQKREVGGWLKVLVGAMVSLTVYLSGTVLLALFLVKGVLGVEMQNALLGVLGCLSVACGGFAVCWGKDGRSVTVLQNVLFVVLLLGGSYLLGDGPAWDRHSAIFLLSVVLGGVLPLVLRGEGKKSKHRRGW